MKARWIGRRLDYDGSQLRPHWILRTTGIVGDAIVAFRGACRLPLAEFADLEDAIAEARIEGDDMVHFVLERFDDGDLDRATVRQRLLAARTLEVVRELSGARSARARLRREGDDLFAGVGKLSISVATKSPVSSLIHLGVNVTTAGTPVRTASLAVLGVDPTVFAREVLARTVREEESMAKARCKVVSRSGA